MSGELEAFTSEPETDETDSIPHIGTPDDLRPDLAAIGIEEVEKGVCEDTYDNRKALRHAHLNWDPVYDGAGRATGLIAARSQETTVSRRLISLQEKKPLLVDPTDKNSDYLTGLDLLIDEKASSIVPPWVLGSTRAFLKEQEDGGPSSPNRAPKGQPTRCRTIKSDGIRCMLWSSGRLKDDGLCRIHLKTQRKPGEDVERARRKLMQAAPYAVDVLEELMDTAESEPVRLKASTEILDRAGVRGGQDINLDVEITDARTAADIVAERLQRLSEGAKAVLEVQRSLESSEEDGEVIDAEVVEEDIPEFSEVNEEIDPKNEIGEMSDLPTDSDEDYVAGEISEEDLDV